MAWKKWGLTALIGAVAFAEGSDSDSDSSGSSSDSDGGSSDSDNDGRSDLSEGGGDSSYSDSGDSSRTTPPTKPRGGEPGVIHDVYSLRSTSSSLMVRMRRSA